jgi:ABC-type sugar transport system ATPase subunit
MIRAENITFRIGEFSLDEASVEVKKGEYFVLMGPPGSGKTLFLEVLCGLKRPQSGRLFIDGRSIHNREPRRRMIGYVPQDYALFPHRSVEGNLRFGLEAAGESGSEADRRVQEIADAMRIGHLLTRRIEGLSGGERQRVALGRALVIRPKVLLLDEPVSALDESTREAICGELKRIQRKFGLATIHVCHQLEEAVGLADRAGILRAGRFQQIGTLDELTHRPVSAFVAHFMRCQNVLTGEAVGPANQRGKSDVVMGRRMIAVPGIHEGRIIIVIRPERIRLLPESGEPAKSAIQLPVEVKRISDRGFYQRVELDASFPLVAHATHEELMHLALCPGMKIAAVVREESIHVLTDESQSSEIGN